MNSNQAIYEAVKKIGLSPTQYERIETSYKALSKELTKEDLEVEVYPQGSMRLGTTIKPYHKNKDRDFDIDLVTEYSIKKSDTEPKKIKSMVGYVLKNNEMYKKKLSEKSRCWRVDYSKENGIGFHADILPSIPEDINELSVIRVDDNDKDLVDFSLAITHKEGSKYLWNMSNPKGYALWFDRVNRYRRDAFFEKKKQIILLENKNLFTSVEEIPDALVNSPLQQVIQVLKRHRDVYFSNNKNEDNKPISIIITTIVAEVVKMNNWQGLSTNDLFSNITRVLTQANKLVENKNFSNYGIKSILFRENGNWYILNPVNRGENFADAWNENEQLPRTFFEWVNAVKTDIVDNLDKPNFQEILFQKLAIPYEKKDNEKKKHKTLNRKNAKQSWRMNV
jgi:hypothetical protein